ncbi:xyloglucan galactosyltransferase MUR3-like isoform X2 [Selaginella moellendorffii]|uniref:xyloglucan galactosyltransferase MUR3-like isoform X2 n=1 Tax=Selaginella moellendorffii TaxID=88036 RepID=UPI000D1CCCB8|nr:xyloglucan galactosyltransferase MUR3-like isoform X2 [Selaginella moellendorffii]XP_024517502.1 xyloglucan galactosyltransferase MUR3-like isoform X2 [Selaginella moellendorffii]XP_024517503.1 xyloglucan galactosyltransferase MUR3-like isoform X2 [Selaginella moellendorffii]XP_024517504.1 xyloglucan galactosyltransferase MUR3-like isoform X2 [Selaginella moellendorffii]|eukprot:XP_024517501.1 xyloglucan galactosyltransferase MUR3-like isoform X2 [Selaginella moellendorffii]
MCAAQQQNGKSTLGNDRGCTMASWFWSCSCGCWMVVTVMATWCLVLLLVSEYWIALDKAAETEIVAAAASYIISTRETPSSRLLERRLTADKRQIGGVRAGKRKTRCRGRYVYMYTLPASFNRGLLEQCDRLSVWTNMCPHIANAGLGQPLNDVALDLTSRAGWYATNQFSAELIFHESMKGYECLTSDWKRATAIYVPFYAGFEMSRHVGQKNVSVRDEAGKRLGKWLQRQEQWKASGGRDHFMVSGRITWDFIRSSSSPESWGNNLLLLPWTRNMSVLLIEARPWLPNEHGIPYPTYFHPSTASQLQSWQQRLRHSFRSRRRRLIGFVGAVKAKNLVRDRVFDQCRKSSQHCRMLDCQGESGGECHDPHRVMELFLSSTFCLQPRGDSFTRRSTFDSLLAGCIPVFFSEYSAYSQYAWNLPADSSSYSVLIPESELVMDGVIETRLLSIEVEEIQRMQEKIVEMVPELSYADPRFQGRTEFVDAFGAVVRGVTRLVGEKKKNVSLRTKRKILPRFTEEP